MIDRRAFLLLAAGASIAAAGDQSGQVSPTPTPRDWSGAEPVQYPDPDIVALDPRFRRYIVGNTPIQRLHTGTLWAEGPAWNGVGRYLVWSDIPNNVQMRWIEDDGRVTVFRNPSGNSNGNTFDYEGRQLSCEHGGRRVVRYEPNGTVTVIADKFQGKRLNSPNDIVVHPGRRHLVHRSDLRHPRQLRRVQGASRSSRKRSTASIRKTGQIDEGRPTRSISPTASASRPTTRSSTSPTPARRARSRSATSTARRCATASASPSSTSRAPARRPRPTASAATSTATSGPARGPGVQVITPNGERIGMIRLPETCANVCFGGASATGCSWPPASRSTRSTSTPPARTSPDFVAPVAPVAPARGPCGSMGFMRRVLFTSIVLVSAWLTFPPRRPRSGQCASTTFTPAVPHRKSLPSTKLQSSRRPGRGRPGPARTRSATAPTASTCATPPRSRSSTRPGSDRCSTNG